ncbi:hypothetical protein [Klebsiella pneumoniae IS10]|nr:hypothetical protein [Klebsiella pneumoniae IS10]CDL48994.1 hypothetical protein [Klebsiella pneumoniae ISC21]
MVAVQVVSETIPLKVMVLSACATVDSALQAEKIRHPPEIFYSSSYLFPYPL